MAGEYYSNQPSRVAFTGVTLSNDYTDNEHEFPAAGFVKLSLDIEYAAGADETGNLLLFKLEHSPDEGTNWYSLVIDDTGSVSTITPRVWNMAAGKMNVIIDIAYKRLRLSLSESGVEANAGTASVQYTLSGL